MHMINGGGALTREKIVSAVADQFVCIVDGTKVVDYPGRFPLPVEVIPMRTAHMKKEMANDNQKMVKAITSQEDDFAQWHDGRSA